MRSLEERIGEIVRTKYPKRANDKGVFFKIICSAAALAIAGSIYMYKSDIMRVGRQLSAKAKISLILKDEVDISEYGELGRLSESIPESDTELHKKIDEARKQFEDYRARVGASLERTDPEKADEKLLMYLKHNAMAAGLMADYEKFDMRSHKLARDKNRVNSIASRLDDIAADGVDQNEHKELLKLQNEISRLGQKKLLEYSQALVKSYTDAKRDVDNAAQEYKKIAGSEDLRNIQKFESIRKTLRQHSNIAPPGLASDIESRIESLARKRKQIDEDVGHFANNYKKIAEDGISTGELGIYDELSRKFWSQYDKWSDIHYNSPELTGLHSAIQKQDKAALQMHEMAEHQSVSQRISKEYRSLGKNYASLPTLQEYLKQLGPSQGGLSDDIRSEIDGILDKKKSLDGRIEQLLAQYNSTQSLNLDNFEEAYWLSGRVDALEKDIKEFGYSSSQFERLNSMVARRQPVLENISIGLGAVAEIKGGYEKIKDEFLKCTPDEELANEYELKGMLETLDEYSRDLSLLNPNPAISLRQKIAKLHNDHANHRWMRTNVFQGIEDLVNSYCSNGLEKDVTISSLDKWTEKNRNWGFDDHVAKLDRLRNKMALCTGQLDYFGMGMENLKTGHYDTAIDYFGIVARIDERNRAGAYNNIGVAYSRMGEPELAQKYYHMAISIDSGAGQAKNNLEKSVKQYGQLYIGEKKDNSGYTYNFSTSQPDSTPDTTQVPAGPKKGSSLWSGDYRQGQSGSTWLDEGNNWDNQDQPPQDDNSPSKKPYLYDNNNGNSQYNPGYQLPPGVINPGQAWPPTPNYYPSSQPPGPPTTSHGWGTR